MVETKIENYKANKTLFNMKAGDTIYIAKMEGAYQHIYLVKFLAFRKGIVIGDVLEADKWCELETGDSITARPTSCFLWGRNDEQGNLCCNWFTKVGVIIR